MQFAAKGALLVPNEEMIEILVHLATRNKVFGEQARLTLAAWDLVAASAVASSSTTPKRCWITLSIRKSATDTLTALGRESSGRRVAPGEIGDRGHA